MKELLIQLVQLYLKSDWDMTDFIKVQRLKEQIIDAYSRSQITWREYNVIYPFANYLVKEIRHLLKKEGMF